MSDPRVLPGFDDRAPPDRYCDLVLTGGVTSAIAYPPVIFGLAQVYRLQSIGGSSSGAGSAALAAAAEYRRRKGSAEGYRTLLRRSAEVADLHEGRCGLEWLFQPEHRHRRLFQVFLRAFAGPRDRVQRFLGDVLEVYANLVIIGVHGGALILGGLAATLYQIGPDRAWTATAWVLVGFFAVLGALLGGAILTGLGLMRDGLRAADDDYGLCSGLSQAPDSAHPPFTTWLHTMIQEVAGLPPDRPLSFEDLSQAPGGPGTPGGPATLTRPPSIDLRMFASNLSLGRPLMLPQSDEDPDLFFRPYELRRLFPSSVVEHMKQSGGRAGPAAMARPSPRDRGNPALIGKDDADFFHLPREKLPVIVAARMSVSFPVLFQAVPLWEREPLPQGHPERGQALFRRLLIADGGLCSNFPIHLFDHALPSWPTFGVSLHDVDVEAPKDPSEMSDLVRVAQQHTDGPPDRWSSFDEQPGRLARLLGFLGAMFSTTKDWSDALMAELPGVRERVAHVGLPRDIGGLNILMRPDQIEWLGQAGAEAARKLLARFASPAAGAAESSGWREHRWIRLNLLSTALQDALAGLSSAARGTAYSSAMAQQIEDALEHEPLKGKPLPVGEALELQRTLDTLLQIEQMLPPRQFQSSLQLRPRPRLRMRSPM